MSSATHWIKGHKSQIKLLLNAFNCPYLLFANPVVRWKCQHVFFLSRDLPLRGECTFLFCAWGCKNWMRGPGMEIIRPRCHKGGYKTHQKCLLPLPLAPTSTSLSLSVCVPVCVDMWVFHNQLITSLCSSGLITEERFDKSSVHVSKNKEFTANQHFM